MTNNNKLIIITLLVLINCLPVFAQQKGGMQFTLKEAQDYALKNSPLIKNANIS